MNIPALIPNLFVSKSQLCQSIVAEAKLPVKIVLFESPAEMLHNSANFRIYRVEKNNQEHFVLYQQKEGVDCRLAGCVSVNDGVEAVEVSLVKFFQKP